MRGEPKYYRIETPEIVEEIRREYPDCGIFSTTDRTSGNVFFYMRFERAKSLGLGKKYGWPVTSHRASDIRMLGFNELSWH